MNLFFADFTDKLTFLITTVFGLIVPVVGLMISISSVQKAGASRRCGAALISFFALMLLGGLLTALVVKDGIQEVTSLKWFTGVAAGHGIAALLAIWGLWHSRKKRSRWQIGRRRDAISFWFNFLGVLGYGIYFFALANPHFFEVKPS